MVVGGAGRGVVEVVLGVGPMVRAGPEPRGLQPLLLPRQAHGRGQKREDSGSLTVGPER